MDEDSEDPAQTKPLMGVGIALGVAIGVGLGAALSAARVRRNERDERKG